MGIFSRFERGMENGIEGAANRMFDAPLSPVQISKKAERAMKREKMVGAGRQYAPTLYTVLVNPDDDQRLFGYYPTLAGETETILAARAAEDGLSMDGQPLVRFIVDEELKHGKFDIIAEMVSAPIIEQLRQEEMARYGLIPQAAAQAPYAAARSQNRPVSTASKPAPYSHSEQQASQARAVNNPVSQQQVYPRPHQGFADQRFEQNAFPPQSQGAQFAQAAQDMHPSQAQGFAPAPERVSPERPQVQAGNIPLPYVPEEEIDRSINYGEYTFDSHDFDSYAQQTPPPRAGAFAAGMTATAQATVPARLINLAANRAWALSASRMIIGRSTASDVVIEDLNASRSHAEMRCDAQGNWLICDLGSTNGTYVNGRRITTQPLHEGDRISIGTTDLTFTLR